MGAIPPDAESGLYIRYILHDYLSASIPFKLGKFCEPKPCHGLPAAALRRALSVVGDAAIPYNVVPKEIPQKLQLLCKLWMDEEFEDEEAAEPAVSSAVPPEYDGEKRWTWGPRATSQHAVDFFVSVKELRT